MSNNQKQNTIAFLNCFSVHSTGTKIQTPTKHEDKKEIESLISTEPESSTIKGLLLYLYQHICSTFCYFVILYLSITQSQELRNSFQLNIVVPF